MNDAQRFHVWEATPLGQPRAHQGKHRVDCEMVKASDYDALLARLIRAETPHKLAVRGDAHRDRLLAARLNLRGATE